MSPFGNLQKKSGNATCVARWTGGMVALCLGMMASPLMAQGLPDPTRPPSGFVDPADAAGGAVAAAQPASDPEAGLVLQSVLLPSSGKPVAVIGGRYVPLGGNVEGWELIKLNEREAVVARGAERRTLKMTPLVTKTPVQEASVPTASATKPVATRKTVRPVKKTSKSQSTKVSCNDELKPK